MEAYLLEMPQFITEYPHFFTATNLQWQHLLKPDKYKLIVIESLKFLVRSNRIKLFAFVIMSNHIHLIWQMREKIKPENVRRDFLKFTAQQIKKDLKKSDPAVLENYRVDAKDREYQFWEKNPLFTELWNEKTFFQKLNYIHLNPVRAGICKFPE
jgi:putative transposase